MSRYSFAPVLFILFLFPLGANAALFNYIADANDITGQYGYTGSFTFNDNNLEVTNANLVETAGSGTINNLTLTATAVLGTLAYEGTDSNGRTHTGLAMAIDPQGTQSYSGGITGASFVYEGFFRVDSVEVPVPAAAWLFGSALIGLAGIKRKK